MTAPRPTLVAPLGAGPSLRFENVGRDWSAVTAAEAYLRARGFSFGPMQSGSPRGVLRGDVVISKWRNLNPIERESLDGVITGDMRSGPVTVSLFKSASAETRKAFTSPDVVSRDRDLTGFVGDVAAAGTIACVAALAILFAAGRIGGVPARVPTFGSVRFEAPAEPAKITLRAGTIGLRAVSREASR